VMIIIIFWRMGARSPVPAEGRGKFIAMLRTSTIFAKLARRTNGKSANKPNQLDEAAGD
jgi:hypothetical protein